MDMNLESPSEHAIYNWYISNKNKICCLVAVYPNLILKWIGVEKEVGEGGRDLNPLNLNFGGGTDFTLASCGRQGCFYL